MPSDSEPDSERNCFLPAPEVVVLYVFILLGRFLEHVFEFWGSLSGNMFGSCFGHVGRDFEKRFLDKS